MQGEKMGCSVCGDSCGDGVRRCPSSRIVVVNRREEPITVQGGMFGPVDRALVLSEAIEENLCQVQAVLAEAAQVRERPVTTAAIEVLEALSALSAEDSRWLAETCDLRGCFRPSIARVARAIDAWERER